MAEANRIRHIFNTMHEEIVFGLLIFHFIPSTKQKLEAMQFWFYAKQDVSRFSTKVAYFCHK